MMFFKSLTSNNSCKDANRFAPSCFSANKNSYIAIIAGIAVAVSVFLCVLCIDIININIIIMLNFLIILDSELKRKKQFIS